MSEKEWSSTEWSINSHTGNLLTHTNRLTTVRMKEWSLTTQAGRSMEHSAEVEW